jgi:hypothetical protein
VIEKDGRLYIDKREVTRRLIHEAIRRVFLGGDPIANHVLIGSARSLIEEYVKASGGKLLFDLEALIKPEHLKGFRDAFKSHYNFFKHSIMTTSSPLT